MRKYIKQMVMAAILVAMAVIYIVLQTNVSPERRSTLAGVREGSLARIAISNADGDITFEKNGEEWQIVEPAVYSADGEIVGLLESILENFEVSRYVKDAGAALDGYGLKDPDTVISITLQSGDQHTFEVGSYTVSQSQRFIKLAGESHVYTMDIGYLDQFEGSINRFRNPDIFDVDINKLQHIKYNRKGSEVLELVKDGEGWKMVYPFETPVHAMALDQFLTDFIDLEAINFVSDSSPDLAALGLLPAQHGLTISDSDGKEQTLLFGIDDGKGETFVNTKEGIDIAKVISSGITFTVLEPMTLMDKAPIRESIQQVVQIEIAYGGQRYTFGLDAGKEPREFTYNGALLDVSEFTSFYVKYMTLVADGHGDAVQAGPPEYTFTSTLKDGETLSLGLARKDDETYYMLIEGEETSFTLKKDRVDALIELMQGLIS